MENTLVRGFVLVLALAGFGASNVSMNSSKPTTGNSAIHSNDLGIVSLPMCPPSDPNHCGLD